MLLYITADDVLGSGSPEGRGPRPLHAIPGTLVGLFDLGLRHHVRAAVMRWWKGETLETVPDWTLDRLAIRFALFGRERLGLEPGGRVAVLGPLGWLWPVVDFASMGFGVLPVGLEHDLSDDAVAAVVAEAAPRAAFGTDGPSAARLLRLRRSGRLGGATVVGEGLAEEPGVVPLGSLVDLAAILDTAERAASFRAFSRQIAPASAALWHAGPRGLVRLTHEEAMADVSLDLRSRPARESDVAYVDGPRATLRKRLGIAAFVGDGYTTTILGRDGHAAEDVTALQPNKVVASEPWLAEACRGRAPRWPPVLERRWARRRVQAVLGGRIRWVEVSRAIPDETGRALAAAGVAVHGRDGASSQVS